MAAGPGVYLVGDEAPQCWCCGRSFTEHEVVRLGSRPEAAVCFRCAAYLNRRARTARDQLAPVHTPAARMRSVAQTARDVVVEHGWHRLPVVGGVLRWIGDRLP